MANVVAGRRSNPSFETVKKILSNEENRISADWLILGIGEMQRGSVVSEDVNELRKKLLAKMEELDNIRTELFELKMELLGDVHNKPDEDNIRKDAV